MKWNDILNEMATAYHGSPHRGIAKFSTDKIGTGEGAQAYGWGLYFTDSPKIAKFYMNKLTVGEEYVNGEILDSYIPVHMLAKTLSDESFSEESTREQLEFMATRGGSASIRNTAQEALKLFDEGQRPTIEYVKPEGELYVVDIPNDDQLLWWDKNMADQPPIIKRALASIPKNVIASAKINSRYGNVTGESIYYELVNTRVVQNERTASEYLASIGIKGIKYLDGDSRNMGEGTYNYVIFNGDDVKILKDFK